MAIPSSAAARRPSFSRSSGVSALTSWSVIGFSDVEKNFLIAPTFVVLPLVGVILSVIVDSFQMFSAFSLRYSQPLSSPSLS